MDASKMTPLRVLTVSLLADEVFGLVDGGLLPATGGFEIYLDDGWQSRKLDEFSKLLLVAAKEWDGPELVEPNGSDVANRGVQFARTSGRKSSASVLLDGHKMQIFWKIDLTQEETSGK